MYGRLIGIGLCALATGIQAHALQPKHDFFGHIKNSTSQVLEVCTPSISFCRALKVDDVFTDPQVTKGQKEKHLDTWLDAMTVKGCGKTMALKEVATLSQKRYDRGAVVYSITITQQRYEIECNKP